MQRDDFYALPKDELFRLIAQQEKVQRMMSRDYDAGNYCGEPLDMVKRINRHAELLDVAQEVYEERFES